MVVENCPSIEELEVLGSIDDDPDRDFNAGGRRGIYILPQELPSISICVNLSKLTIADVDIVDGLFLTEVKFLIALSLTSEHLSSFFSFF